MDLQSVKSKYFQFGIQLDIPSYTIEAWEIRFQRDADRMLEKILLYVFDNHENSMETIYAALMNIDQHNLAEKFEFKYGATQGNNYVESL